MEYTKEDVEKYSIDDILNILKDDHFVIYDLTSNQKKDFRIQKLIFDNLSRSQREWFSYEFTNDFINRKEIVIKLFDSEENHSIFHYQVSEKFKTDKLLMEELIVKQPVFLYSLSDNFRDNKKLILKLLESELEKKECYKNYESNFFINIISQQLQNDSEIVDEFMKLNIDNFKYINENYKSKYLNLYFEKYPYRNLNKVEIIDSVDDNQNLSSFTFETFGDSYEFEHFDN